MKVDDVCRDMGIALVTFYNWRKKYESLKINEEKRLKELESKSSKLKK